MGLKLEFLIVEFKFKKLKIQSIFPVKILSTTCDLPDSTSDSIVKMINRLRSIEADRTNNSSESGFTGDHIVGESASQIFKLPQLEPLNNYVLSAAKKYLSDISDCSHHMCIHIQKAWPVIITKGRGLNPHKHRNAHLSAVYYPKLGSEIDIASIVFEKSDFHEEEFIPIYSSSKEFRFNVSSNLLIVFPSHLKHYVASDSPNAKNRYSISYDLIISTKLQNEFRKSNEMLVTHPGTWKTDLA